MVNPQKWLENNYSDKENTTKINFNFNSNNQEINQGELTITSYPNLEEIRVTGSKDIKNIIKLTINNCPKLKEVNITNLVDNQKLEIISCPNLKELFCGNNQLTNLDFLNNLNSQKLEKLILNDNNFPTQDLEAFAPFHVFSPFKELKILNIGGMTKKSNFTGSLKPLQNMSKLEILEISNTDISYGLEYLSESVKEVHCLPIGSDAKVSDIYEELQSFGGDIIKWRKVKLEKKPQLLVSPLMPPQLLSKTKWQDKIKECKKKFFDPIVSQSLERFDYDRLHFDHWKLTKLLLPNESPTKLYNIQTGKVEFMDKWIGNLYEYEETNREPYAILSYVWGEKGSEAMEKSPIKRDWGKKEVTNSANKALTKALKALEIINKKLPGSLINYLWVDQLCMNQEDQHEKSEEVPRMGKYYDNSALTLIAMDSKVDDTNDIMKVLVKIVNSEWFSRSWTYQEGWLSKHTIFMFDDKLIDGYAMAGFWVLHQPSYIDGGKYLSHNEFDRGTKKIATPVGWVYYRDGYNAEQDKVELTLTQALYAIKNRKRTEPLDGIYSILGLLPYGQEVRVDYSKNNNLEQALKEVTRIAIKNGYAEPLVWHGISNKYLGLCCLPQIDENGSTSVMGSVGKISSIHKNFVDSKITKLITLTYQGIDFNWLMPHYTIIKPDQIVHKLERGFEIEGGIYRKKVKTKPRDTEENPIEISLLGTFEALELAKENTILVILYKEWFKTNKLFALLVKETNQKDIYHRLGLVELANSEEVKFTTEVTKFKKKTIVGADNSESQFQDQIEIPLKKFLR